MDLQLQGGELQIIDSDDILKGCIVFFAFPKSKSANFPIALSIAQAGAAYGEQNVNGRILYWTGFKNSIKDIEKAAELLRLAGSWVGSMAKINGCNITKPFNAYLTLSCYLKGVQSSNRFAYCHKIIEDPFHPDYDVITQKIKLKPLFAFDFSHTKYVTEKARKHVFPCKKMLESSPFHQQFKFNQLPNVLPHEEIEAAAIEYGINICPFFAPKDFREIENMNSDLIHITKKL